MNRSKARLLRRQQRPVLSDVLPFEVPVSFSNRHFYDFLTRHNVRLNETQVEWDCDNSVADATIRLLCGAEAAEAIIVVPDRRSSKNGDIRAMQFEADKSLVTIPFNFTICHKESQARQLSIPHPFNQIALADFYNRHCHMILYYASRSPFSIRKPSAVARFSYFKDRTHHSLLSDQGAGVEEHDKEYEQIGSFFVYRDFSNVYKFFESYKYHSAEKRFDAMIQLDISKCFDSIYTHSIAWALIGKEAVKADLGDSKTTFAGRFDRLMAQMNQNETNGILIGPEFSRIFAELILQSVDFTLAKTLRTRYRLHNRKEYEIFRYVDDYFIFYNRETDANVIVENLAKLLAEMKLHLNDAKLKKYQKPIITEITIAKDQIKALLISTIRTELTAIPNDNPDAETTQKVHVNIVAREIIVRFKTIIKTSGVAYREIINYTFSIIESQVDKLIADFYSPKVSQRSEKNLVNSLVAVAEFCFFIYAAAPRVNLSIRVTRIVIGIAQAMRNARVSFELRHQFQKYAHDNLVHQIKKNRMSEFKEVENLYLLIALANLGREYWLEESILCQYLGIDRDNITGEYSRPSHLNHFSITVCLMYIKHKKRYNKLRTFLETHSVDKVSSRHHYKHRDAETLMLFLDLLACPYVSEATKDELSAIYGRSRADVADIIRSCPVFFTTWKEFNLLDELDAKRSREVY